MGLDGGGAPLALQGPARVTVDIQGLDADEFDDGFHVWVKKQATTRLEHVGGFGSGGSDSGGTSQKLQTAHSLVQVVLGVTISCLSIAKLIEEIRVARAVRRELATLSSAFASMSGAPGGLPSPDTETAAAASANSTGTATDADAATPGSQAPAVAKEGSLAAELDASLPPAARALARACRGAAKRGAAAGDESVGWASISGLDEVKQVLQEVTVLPTVRPDLFQGVRQPPRGVLLFGPPGSGKTLLARAVARESGARFFPVTGSSVLSMWYGQSEANVRALFEQARQHQPSVIFIDEVDSLLGKRSGGPGESGGNEGGSTPDRRVTNELLAFMDGIRTDRAGDARVVVLAATNHPWELDEAALSRFTRRIYVPLPDRASRAKLMADRLTGVEVDITPEQYLALAEKCSKYSGRDLVQLCREAAMRPVRELWGGSRLLTTRPEATVASEAAREKVVRTVAASLRRGGWRRARHVRLELQTWLAGLGDGAPDWCTVDQLMGDAQAFLKLVGSRAEQMEQEHAQAQECKKRLQAEVDGKPQTVVDPDGQADKEVGKAQPEGAPPNGKESSGTSSAALVASLDQLAQLPPGKVRPVRVEDFEAALQQVMPAQEDSTQAFEEFNERFGSGADIKRGNTAPRYMHIYL